MSSISQTKKQIRSVLKAISASDFLIAAKDLLDVLGYQSDRTQELSGSVDEFVQEFPAYSQNTQTRQAFRKHVRSVRLIFQVTSDEIASVDQPTLGFEADSFDKGQQQSFMFFVVELKERTYARGQYAQLTREINKRLSQPTVVLFRTTNHRLTLSFVHRREHKRDPGRDVLGHVSLVREIDPADPHRAHLDILAELSLAECSEWIDIHNESHNFDGLLAAWLDKLDTEELNRRFYGELFDWFKRAAAEAKFPSTVLAEQQVIRLITRILFVWFIKEKGLVREEWFVPAEMKKLLNDFGGSDYYRAVLQNLFFATLNTEMGLRGFSTRTEPSHRVFSRFRYQSLIRDTERFEDLMKQTPFINGGLFDCLDDEESRSAGGRRVDMFSDPDPSDGPRAAQARREAWRELNVPDALFFDEDYGLFPLLNDYKFTVEENTPIEQEVALDPELLGKVFENLLAAYNPETRDTVRRQTGSYYTPRVVVDYMVEEALVATLAEKAQPDDGDSAYWQERLRYLLDYEDAFDDANELFEEDEAGGIVRAIAEIKVLDPAVGSGAFPMGVLHKLTLALQRIDPYNEWWETLQKERATQRAAVAFDTSDQQERDDELTEISDTFERYRDSDFGRKLYIIQNSIFGVDIQPVACQIAKLRFFISLAIEQEANETADNFGIKPLPNLETRFVAANTLLNLDKPVQMSLGQTNAVNRLEQELKRNRERHFHATTRQQKFDCREKDAELREELAAELEGAGFSSDTAEKIAYWNPYDQNAFADWFDSEYMFGISAGFDVIIGNPPYISHDKISKRDKAKIKGQYHSYQPFADIYCYFIEKAIDLQNEGGILSFITSNSYLRAEYGKPIREFLRSKNTLLRVLSIEDSQIFESAIVNVAIIVSRKSTNFNNDYCIVVNSPFSGNIFEEFVKNKGFNCPQSYFNIKSWNLIEPKFVALQKKIELSGKTLEQLGSKIRLGIATGSNEAFIIDESKKSELCRKNSINSEIIKPILRGKDISRYVYTLPKLYILLTKNEIDVEKDYPDIYKYLDSFGDKFKKRGAQGRHWTNLRACSFYDDFKKEKIVWIELADSGRFALCDEEIYLLNSAYFLLPPFNMDSRFLLGILNSSTIRFYLSLIAETSGMGTSRWINNYVKEFPIPTTSNEQQAVIIQIVNYIIYLKKQSFMIDENLEHARDYVMVRYFEQIIDGLVYELYLTDELHSAGKYFFEPMQDYDLPLIKEISGDKMSVLRNIFEQLFDSKHPIRKNIFFLDSLEPIRIIEGKS